MKIIKFFTLIYFTFFIYSISYGENFNTWKTKKPILSKRDKTLITFKDFKKKHKSL